MTIKEIRAELGMTQQELADKMNVAQSTVANWESGIRSPNIRTARRLAEALCCTEQAIISAICEARGDKK